MGNVIQQITKVWPLKKVNAARLKLCSHQAKGKRESDVAFALAKMGYIDFNGSVHTKRN